MFGKFELFVGFWFFFLNVVGGDFSIVLSIFFMVIIIGDGKGMWVLMLDVIVVQCVEVILGKNYFDQFVLVFKVGDEFVVYDFMVEQFGVVYLFVDDLILNFFGIYDVSNIF